MLAPAVILSVILAGFEMHPLASGFGGPSGIHVADIDLDGHPDVLASGWNCDEISYWINSGDPLPDWERHLVTDSLDEASSCSSGDVNGDQVTDIAACGWDAGKVLLFIGDGAGGWTEYTVTDDLPEAHEVHIVDIDMDGSPDIAAASASSAAAVWWRNSGGDPSGWSRQDICTTMPGGRSLCFADFDGDGDLDAAGCGLACDDVRWWENSGGAVPSWTEHLIMGTFNGAHMVRSADVNMDGHPDIAGAAFLSGRPRIWLNSGTVPVEWEQHLISDDIGLAMGVDFPDLNGDGLPDLAATSLNPHQISAWINNGESPSTWEKILIDGTIVGAWPLGSGDLNGDGHVDLAAGANESGYMRWYENVPTSGCAEAGTSNIGIILQRNPSMNSIVFSLQLDEPQVVALTVHDLTGRTICGLWEGTAPGAGQSFTWNGCSSEGTFCNEGVYLIRASSSTGISSVRKVTLLR